MQSSACQDILGIFITAALSLLPKFFSACVAVTISKRAKSVHNIFIYYMILGVSSKSPDKILWEGGFIMR